MADRRHRRDGPRHHRDGPRRQPPPLRVTAQAAFLKVLVPPPCAEDDGDCFAGLAGGAGAPLGAGDARALEEADAALRAAKAALDKYEADADLPRALRAVYPFSDLRQRVAREFGAQVVTNAWLKMYEIVSQMGLFDVARRPGGGGLRAFCNAELPGAFVSALNHYACAWGGGPFEWAASSLYPGTEAGSDPREALGDVYGLREGYPDRWLMDAQMRGDVTSPADVRELARRARARLGEVDLYTSDVGIDVSEDYGDQERLTARLNLGQIVVGLLALRQGGALVTKTYTFFQPFSLSVAALCAALFEAFYVTKPLTSRPANSETYFVGIGFRGLPPGAEEFLLGAVGAHDFGAPLCPLGLPGLEHTVQALRAAALQVHGRQQVAVLGETVAAFEAHRADLAELRRRTEWAAREAEGRWLVDNPVEPLRPACRLRVFDRPRR